MTADTIGPIRLKYLSPLHVEQLLDRYRDEVSGTTLLHIYGTLRSAWNKAKRWRLVTGDNPCAGVDPPAKSKHRLRPLEQDEIQQLLRTARGDLFYPLYLLAIWTGLREGELLGLQWADIDFEAGWLHVRRSLEGSEGGKPIFGEPKTEKSERDVPLSPLLLAALAEHRSRQLIELRVPAGSRWKEFGLVFTQKNGGPINASNLRNRHFHPLLQRAGLRKIRFHDLRHTAATLLLTDLGYDVKTVQEILGHSKAQTTLDIYGHGRNHKKKEAVQRMDSLLRTSMGDTNHE